MRTRWLLLGLVAVSAGLRLLGALQVPSPWFTPDEQTYAALGRSLYHSGRYEILGRPAELLSLLYPALAGLPLVAAGPTTGYVALKVVQALILSATAAPVYLWARSLSARRWALGAAVLTVAVPGLAFSGFVMTEVLFYPALLLAAWAMATALARPTLWNQGVLVGAIVVALAVRLQAVVLLPVLVLAIGLKLVFDRAPPRTALRLAPAIAALAALGLAWAMYRLLGGSGGGGLLGAYQTTGVTPYGFLAAVRFTLYHAADLLLMTALVPVVAVALLAARAFRAAEPSEPVRAYVAVAVALTLGLVSEIGLFTSRLLGRLGERYLLGLAPVLFVGLAVWLDRGAPRPRLATTATAVAALLLLVYLPFDRFVTEAAEPDAFTIIPLYQLRTRWPGASVELVVVLSAAALLLLMIALPRRLVWVAPAVSLLLLASASVSATRVVAAQARGFRQLMVGHEVRWIDRAAHGPVAFLHADEYPWAAGGQVWANLFWNSSLRRVYDLAGFRVAGLIPQYPVRPAPDGRLLVDGLQVPETQIVASNDFTFFGSLLDRQLSFALWRLDPPARVSTRLTGIRLTTGDVDVLARLTVYACRGGVLHAAVSAPESRPLEIDRNGKPYAHTVLQPGVVWSTTVPAPRSAGGICSFELRPIGGGLHLDALDFVRPR